MFIGSGKDYCAGTRCAHDDGSELGRVLSHNCLFLLDFGNRRFPLVILPPSGGLLSRPQIGRRARGQRLLKFYRRLESISGALFQTARRLRRSNRRESPA